MKTITPIGILFLFLVFRVLRVKNILTGYDLYDQGCSGAIQTDQYQEDRKVDYEDYYFHPCSLQNSSVSYMPNDLYL